MNITAIRVGRTFNLGNYESKKVELEATFENGETFEDGLKSLTDLVEAQGDSIGADTGKPSPKKTTAAKPQATKAAVAKATSTAPPLAGKGKTKDEAPFEPGKKIAAEPAPKKAKAKKKQQAEVQSVEDLMMRFPEITRVADVLDTFTEMRSVADRTKGEAVDAWEDTIKQVAAHLRSIPGYTEDACYEDLCSAFDAEQEAIATARG